MSGAYGSFRGPPLSARPPVIGGDEKPAGGGGEVKRDVRGVARSHYSTCDAAPLSDDMSVNEFATPSKRMTTPRYRPDHSDQDCTPTNKCRLNRHRAHLGFEPEGSASRQRVIDDDSMIADETATPPSYRRWAQSLRALLQDSEGVSVFKQFLDFELAGGAASNSLDFWFACNGLKLVDHKDTKRIYHLARLIYKKFIKSDELGLTYESRHKIAERLKTGDVDQTLFDTVQADVESYMRVNMYPLFLKSDSYIAYMQSGGSESPAKSSNNSTDSSVAPTQGPLPTLHEDQELKQEDIKPKQIKYEPGLGNMKQLVATSEAEAAVASMLALTPQSLMATRGMRSDCFKKPEGVYPKHLPVTTTSSTTKTTASKRQLNPYHVTYATISTRDSELQSMSSDAQTTDDSSSIDGRGSDLKYGTGKHWRKHRSAAARHNANLNRRTGLNEPLIARTDCVPKDRNLAETSPKAFAAMLSDRLLRLKQEQDQYLHVQQRLRRIENTMESDSSSSMKSASCHSSSVSMIANALGAAAAHASQAGSTQNHAPNTTNSTTTTWSDSAQSILEDHVSRIWDSSSGETPLTSRSPVAGGQQKPSPFDHRGPLPGDRQRNYNHYHNHQQQQQQHNNNNSRSNQSITSHVFTPSHKTTSKDGSSNVSNCKDPASERVMAWISGNTHVPATTRTQYSTDQSDRTSSSIQKHKRSVTSRNQTDIQCRSFSHADTPLQHITHAMSKSMLSHDEQARLMMPPPAANTVFSRHQTYPLDLSYPMGAYPSPYNTQQQNCSQCQVPPPPPPQHNITTAAPRKAPPTVPATRPRLPASTDNHVTVVGYYFCGEPIPYRSTVSTPKGVNAITLAQFKQLITKRGHYRYFFKKACDEFDSGVVHEEISEDSDYLPLWEGKVIAKVERIE